MPDMQKQPDVTVHTALLRLNQLALALVVA